MRPAPQLAAEAPEIRCKQGARPKISKEPAADEWVEWIPPKPGSKDQVGVARLSERAVSWIYDVLASMTAGDKLRDTEHKCLDAFEKKGLIRQ